MDWIDEHFFLSAAIVVVVVVAFCGIFAFWAESGQDEREAKFKNECESQGGHYVKFDQYKGACVIDGEKFWR